MEELDLKEDETPEIIIKQAKPRSVKTKVENVKNKRHSSKPGDIDPDTLGKFVQGIFGVAAVIGGSHWVIDETESEAISGPLSHMINKMNKKKKDSLNNLLAPILLVTAIGTVVVPRAMISIQLIKLERERLKYANENFGPIRQNSADPIATNNGGYEKQQGIDRGIIDDGEAIASRVYSTIPASD